MLKDINQIQDLTRLLFYILLMQARHKEFIFITGSAEIEISSNFDSGNLQNARLQNQRVVLTPAYDPMHPQYSIKPSSKTFFHFKVKSNEDLKLCLRIQRMKILEYFQSQQQFDDLYRVCIGKKSKKAWSSPINYQKIKPMGMKRVEVQSGFELHFEIELKQQQETYLAYHYPYPYEKCQQFMHQITERINNLNNHHNANIYFANELLIQSLEGRSVNLITLTHAGSAKLQQKQPRISKSLFPYFQIENRPNKFNKPYVLLTSRVHSGETSASYALEGIFNFLLSHDQQSQLLLHSFVFLIVPVLNPDGVYHGTYRMDTLGHNLNRFYNTALSHKQPSIFAIQTIANYYGSRIVFFMDLHSHPHPNKGSFIYGNCLPGIEDQTETQLFAKLLSYQSQCFGYHWSSFSVNQMSSRDINQILTKDGSARVQLYRILSIPFAFTMQIGYHGCAVKNREESSVFLGNYRRNQSIFTIQDYHQHGKSIMRTLLKLFMFGGTKALQSQQNRFVQQSRESICKQLIEKEERFRQMDGFVFKKIKLINQIIYQQYYQQIYKKYSVLDFLTKAALKTLQASLPKDKFQASSAQDNQQKRRAVSQNRQKAALVHYNSKTIDHSSFSQKNNPIKSFKSTIDARREIQFRNQVQPIKSRRQNIRFAKQLNLNFNPFPDTERKKIYNVIGNQRSQLKKTAINELKLNNREFFDIVVIDQKSQLEKAEQSFNKQQKDVLRSFRLNFFNSDSNQNDQEENLYNDEGLDNNFELHHFMFPKIPNKSDRKEQPYNLQAQLAKKYDRQYSIRDQRHLSTLNVKSTLRSNSLRMRSLVKSMK